ATCSPISRRRWSSRATASRRARADARERPERHDGPDALEQQETPLPAGIRVECEHTGADRVQREVAPRPWCEHASLDEDEAGKHEQRGEDLDERSHGALRRAVLRPVTAPSPGRGSCPLRLRLATVSTPAGRRLLTSCHGAWHRTGPEETAEEPH